MMNTRTFISCLLTFVVLPGCMPAAQQIKSGTVAAPMGILVVAPDRGFMGNEETRAALSSLDYGNKSLVFITDERSRDYLDQAVAGMTAAGTGVITVLPLFISPQHPDWQLARRWLADDICGHIECRFAKAFGRSYLAVDVLDEALREIPQPENRNLVLMGFGADNAGTVERMAEDWNFLADRSSLAGKFRSVTSTVWNTLDNNGQQREKLSQLMFDKDTVVLSIHLGRKLDSMMNFDASLRHWLRERNETPLQSAPIGADILGLWIEREANRALIQGMEDLGVVILAHGSDFLWNQTMREALEHLHSRYAIEYAFSMADRPSIESALARLRERGLKGAVIVRVFGRGDSFKGSIEKMIGLDVEAGGHSHHAHHAGHAMGGGRIRTPLIVTSTGGLDAHPLFAEALLDRAGSLSRLPGRETIILVAHGTGDDGANAVWMKTLERLAQRMRDLGGDRFRAIKYATWREDWPEKRGEWIARVRDMVMKAGEDGGRAIVIPARTNGRGPEHRFLEGLAYTLGEGFAPHPLFARWVEAQILEGAAALSPGQPDMMVQQ